MSKFKAGDKIKIPKCQKDFWGSLDTAKTSAVREARALGNDYIYVTRIEDNESNITVGHKIGVHDSSFHEKDLELYEEFPENWAILSIQNVEIYKEMEEIILNSPYENPWRWNGNAGKGYYYIDTTNRWDHSSYLPTGYVEITTKQYKKQFMNETAKKIIGYKSPIDLYGTSLPKGTLYVKREETNHFYVPVQWKNDTTVTQPMPKEVVETWEPVYEEEFKVGDWVTYIGGGRSMDTTMWVRGKVTGKITKIERDQFYVTPGSNHKDGFRKATPEEIKAVTDVTIAGHKAERDSFGGIRFGCQSFSKNELYVVERLLSSTEIKAKLSIQGTPITPDIVKKVLNLL